jgi:hypothetical protein
MANHALWKCGLKNQEVSPMKRRGWIAAAMVCAMLFVVSGTQLAAPPPPAAQCFQPFSGVFIMFNKPVTSTSTAQNGRVFGSLSGCAGLVSWPIVGSSHVSRTDGLVLAFRAFTVDAGSCGAVDWIGTLKGTPLSGPFQLWNQRTSFGNTGTWTQVACPAPPEQPAVIPAGTDALGNSTR